MQGNPRPGSSNGNSATAVRLEIPAPIHSSGIGESAPFFGEKGSVRELMNKVARKPPAPSGESPRRDTRCEDDALDTFRRVRPCGPRGWRPGSLARRCIMDIALDNSRGRTDRNASASDYRTAPFCSTVSSAVSRHACMAHESGAARNRSSTSVFWATRHRRASVCRCSRSS